MRLWDWASETYARPGVEALCLRLQDEHGQCVSFLLWAAWMSSQRVALTQPALARMAALTREWETTVLAPLRSVRRALKHPVQGFAAADQEQLRNRIRAEELAAERLLLEALEALTPTNTIGIKDLGWALCSAVLAWGVVLSPALMEELTQAFSDG